MRSIGRCSSVLGVRFEPLDQGGGALPSRAIDENRVVAGDRADRLRQLRAVERLGERLRLAAAGADDDELLHALDAAQELGGGALERGRARSRGSCASAPGRW